jgi:serine/threonine-protein kinase
MGEVRRATDESLDRQVAVKVLVPVPGTLALPERFLREAQATARIESPHVVSTYDFGADEERYFLVMELLSGVSVADELSWSGAFDPDRAVRIVRQAAAGLAAAHRLGIVHRDVKASNLLLTPDDGVKVADFGIARFLDDGTTSMTAAGVIVGSTHYLAPERALGKPAEPPADIYALGCVLYQMVTGHPPFMAESPASIMYQHVESTPAPPSDLRPELAGEVEALLFWMLDKDPARRPTAVQVAEGAEPPVPRKPADVTPVTAEVPLAGLADPLAPVAPLAPVRRRRPVLAGVGAAVALAVAVGTSLALQTKGVELPATTDLTPVEQPVGKPSARPTAKPTADPTKTSVAPTARTTSTVPRSTRTAPVTQAVEHPPTVKVVQPGNQGKSVHPTKAKPQPGKKPPAPKKKPKS